MFNNIIKKVNKLSNLLLDLDPQKKILLDSLNSEVLIINITDYNLNLKVSEKNQQLLLEKNNNFTSENVCTLTATLSNFIQLLTSKSPQTIFQKNLVVQTGNIFTLEKYQNIIKSFEIDWEFYLQEIFGDEITNCISLPLLKINSTIKHSNKKILSDISEYIVEEKQFLVNNLLITDFIEQTQELSRNTSRIESKINYLKSLL